MILEEYESVDALLNSNGNSVAIVKKRIFAFKEVTLDRKKDVQAFKTGLLMSKPHVDPIKMSASNAFLCYTDIVSCSGTYSSESARTFSLIEILGPNVQRGINIYCTAIKVIRDLDADEIANLTYEFFIHLAEIKRIQILNPFIHVGGSAALYLHGIKLKRVTKGSEPSDIDMCSPFYMPITGSETDVVEFLEDDERSDQADFKEVVSFNGIPIDYRIDPKEKFEVIKFKGFDYKVTKLETIMEAKFRYALCGSLKHKEDCYEICSKNKPSAKPIVPAIVNSYIDEDDLPW